MLNMRWKLSNVYLCPLLFLCSVLVIQPAKVESAGQGQCVWYGECNADGDKKQNCFLNGTDRQPKHLKDAAAYEIFKTLCPSLAREADNNTEPLLCCDAKQIHTFDNNMGVPRQLLQRCPSCFFNFAQLWCQSTCNPRQSEFIQVDSTEPKGNIVPHPYVTGITYYIEHDYAVAMFNSCRNVQYPGSNQYALDLMCGTDHSLCTPQKWLDNLGSPTLAPFTIKFLMESDTVVEVGNTTYSPMNASTVPCTQAPSDEDLPCSCQDCVETCVAVPPYPGITHHECEVGNMECLVFISLLAFGGLTLVTILMAALNFVIAGTPVVKYASNTASDANFPCDDDYRKPHAISISESDIRMWESWGAWLEEKLCDGFQCWGRTCTRHPILVFLFGLSVSIAFSSGIYHLEVTTDPVKLWSSPGSRARVEKQFFDSAFAPFYRTEQLIIVPKDQSFFHPDAFFEQEELWGPAFRKAFLVEVLSLQHAIMNLNASFENEYVTLNDICFKPLYPDNNKCAVLSVLQYFQNNETTLYKTALDESVDYLYQLKTCFDGPMQVNTSMMYLSCLSDFGAPIFPYTVLGGGGSAYMNSTALVINIIVNNHDDPAQNMKAEAWEKRFLEFIGSYNSSMMTINYQAQRSIQDEINRESQSDVSTILISYSVMFLYIAFSLGQYNVYNNNLLYLLVQSKIMLGLTGVFIVLLSVTTSVGFYAYCHVPATLIIVEVVPFLVLAVGVDNIFILVQSYQRDRTSSQERLESRIGRICGEVIPTMLLSSFSECFCFFLGALSSMPAVKIFSLYAAMAIFFNFFLQVTCFLALFTLDIRRQESGRMEVLCCAKLPPHNVEPDGGCLHNLVKDYYAPFLLSFPVRVTVLIVFLGWLCSSVAVLNKIEVGLDQKLSMPEDSYVLRYFEAMEKYLSVGPPVYFIVKGEYNYSNNDLQNSICGSAGCLQNSLYGQIYQAAMYANKSYVAHPVSSWLDDYFDWLRPVGNPPCCRIDNKTGDFCPSLLTSDSCVSCDAHFTSGRPPSFAFDKFLNFYLKDNPGQKCAKGGHAAYGQALAFSSDNRVNASYFMTYHTVLKTSDDYVNAIVNARSIADNITSVINSERTPGSPTVQVFPYSVFYVFYEQYLTVVHDSVIQLILSVAAIFFVSTVLLGLDPWSAACIVITIVFILLNLLGLMHWWSINLNAISLVNLVMAVGIAVEFCSHIVRAFAISMQRSRLLRANEALSTMGSSVLSGITLTKFGGIVVLAFSHSQIFQVFYFRMYLGIVLYGATHGLIFLPVLLSFIGPSVNKKKLLQRQRHELLANAGLQQPSVNSLIHEANVDNGDSDYFADA